MQHDGTSPESMIRCRAITGFWINWQVFPSKSFSVSSFLTLFLSNLHHLLLLTNDFPLWGRNETERTGKSEASRVGHEHLWAWGYHHLLILLAKRPYLIKTLLIWSWPSEKRTQKKHIKQLNTKLKQRKDQRIWVCVHVGACSDPYTHTMRNAAGVTE